MGSILPKNGASIKLRAVHPLQFESSAAQYLPDSAVLVDVLHLRCYEMPRGGGCEEAVEDLPWNSVVLIHATAAELDLEYAVVGVVAY